MTAARGHKLTDAEMRRHAANWGRLQPERGLACPRDGWTLGPVISGA